MSKMTPNIRIANPHARSHFYINDLLLSRRVVFHLKYGPPRILS